jgi:hypothetical protein
MPYPTITATHGTLTCRIPVLNPDEPAKTAPTPMTPDTTHQDPGWFTHNPLTSNNSPTTTGGQTATP